VSAKETVLVVDDSDDSDDIRRICARILRHALDPAGSPIRQSPRQSRRPK